MNASNLLKVEAGYLYSIVYMNVHLQNVCVTVVSDIIEKHIFFFLNVFQSHVTSPVGAALRLMERQTYSRDPRFYIGPEARVP